MKYKKVDMIYNDKIQLKYLPDYNYEWNLADIEQEYAHYFSHGIKLRDQSVVFDVGAYIGVFSLMVYDRCEGAITSYLFEPIKPLYDIMSKNVESYNGLIPVNCGITDWNGQQDFSYFPNAPCLTTENSEELKIRIEHLLSHADDNQDELNDIFEGMAYEVDTDNQRLRQIAINYGFRTIFYEEIASAQVITLSDFMREKQIEAVDLLKVDVGDCFYNIFKGINSYDWEKIEQVLVKVPSYSGEKDQLVGLLKEKGFCSIHCETYGNDNHSAYYLIFAFSDK